MKQWIARRMLKGFSERYGYDVGYMERMLEVSPEAFFRFSKIQGVSRFRRVAPRDAYYAVKLIAAADADCGPCTQLCVEMAREAGMPDDQIEAVLAGDDTRLGEPARVGAAFARALAADRRALDPARERVVELWGEQAVVELSLCFAIGQVFPVVKTGMGFGKECLRVTVSERPVDVLRHAV